MFASLTFMFLSLLGVIPAGMTGLSFVFVFTDVICFCLYYYFLYIFLFLCYAPAHPAFISSALLCSQRNKLNRQLHGSVQFALQP
jgi:hypothetical protein